MISATWGRSVPAFLTALALTVSGCGGPAASPAATSATTAPATVAATAAATPAASRYPVRAVTVIVPATAGGNLDTVARTMAEAVSKVWGQPVNVVNKPGASTVTGSVEALQAAPDGYTLLAVGTAAVLIPAVQPSTPFRPADFDAIVGYVTSTSTLVVKADSPYRTARELADAIKKDPTAFSFSAGGLAASGMFGAAAFIKAAGADVTQVKRAVFDGGAPAMAAVAAGQATFSAQATIEAIPLVKAGKLRALFTTGKKREGDLPDVPTAVEAGFPTVTQGSISGLAARKGIPAHVIQSWNEAVKKVLDDPAVVKKLRDLAFEPSYSDAAGFRKLMDDMYTNAEQVAKELKLAQ